MTFSITTLSIMTLNITMKIHDAQHNDSLHNDFQHCAIEHNNKNVTLSMMTFIIIILETVMLSFVYAEYRK